MPQLVQVRGLGCCFAVSVPTRDPSGWKYSKLLRCDLFEEILPEYTTVGSVLDHTDLLAEALPVSGINLQRLFSLDGLGRAGRRNRQLSRSALSGGGGGEQTIDKNWFGSFMAIQVVEMDRHFTESRRQGMA